MRWAVGEEEGGPRRRPRGRERREERGGPEHDSRRSVPAHG
jgi:hypothetical protein